MINPKKIKQLRIQRAWTQEKLAEISKISLRTIQRIEKGSITASFESIQALSKALEVSIEELKKPVEKEPQKQTSQKQTASQESFLTRMTSGTDLLHLINNSEMYAFSHDDLKTEEEVELVSGFLQNMQDYGDILPELEIGEHVRISFTLEQLLKDLEGKHFWVFGCRTKKRIDETTIFNVANIKVLRENNPEIIKGSSLYKTANCTYK